MLVVDLPQDAQLPPLAHGVVGEVLAVGPTASIVRLIIDPQCNIPARIKQSKQQIIASGNDEVPDTLKLNYHPRHEKNLKEGYIVETSGLNGYFDSGLYIGEISQIKPLDPDQLFHDAIITPAAEFNKMVSVVVLKPHLSKEEREILLNKLKEMGN